MIIFLSFHDPQAQISHANRTRAGLSKLGYIPDPPLSIISIAVFFKKVCVNAHVT